MRKFWRKSVVSSNDNVSGKSLITAELLLIYEQTHTIASIQFVQARVWRTVNHLLSLPAASTAALAGGFALAGSANAALIGVLALVAATLSSLQGALNAQRRQAMAEQSANAYLEVRNKARRLASIDSVSLNVQQLRRDLHELTLRQEEVNRSVEPPSWIAIKLGRRASGRRGEMHQQFFLRASSYDDQRR